MAALMSPRARTARTKEDQGHEAAGQAPRAGDLTRTKILHSAEDLFGEHGFDGVSVRQIALAAGVPVALVNYHFGGKEGLYRAIFEMRSPAIVDDRLAGLRLAELEPNPDRKLELIIRALIVPMIHLRNTEKNSSYARILARETSSPSRHSKEIIGEFFDPVARKVTEAMMQALPDRRPEEIHWAYHTMIGAMVFIMADTGRINRLSDGTCDPDDEMSTATHLVALLHAALKHGRVPEPPRKGNL